MRDIRNNISAVQSIKPSSYTATENGVAVDTQGFSAAMVLFYLWIGDYASADEVYTPKVQESDDATNWNDVAAADLDGSFTVVDEAGDEGLQTVGYQGSKRYLRSVVTIAGTTPSIIASAAFLLGEPHRAPAA